MAISLYGISVTDGGYDETEQRLLIEMEAIRRGGKWFIGNAEYGNGLPYHFKQMRLILWPFIDSHRWNETCNDEIRRLNAKVTVLMGSGSTGKTNVAAWEYLAEYYCNPDDTLVLISSTDFRGLELRVWGEIKMLHEKAIEKFPWLSGYLIDSKHCITTDQLEEDEVTERMTNRDLRKGIIGIPTVQGGKNVGLGKWIGVKQKHLRLIADDVTAMSNTFLSAFANLNNNIDFQAIICFNPSDMLDPGGIAAEPSDGWTNHMEPEKTTVWDTKFFNGRCVNLVGTDSPNFDYPENEPPRFPYLTTRKKIEEIKSAFKEDTYEFYSQCKGVMRIGQMARRVITRDLCKQFDAQGDCLWDGSGTKKIAALDSAYEGDRCVGGHIEFGRCLDGKVRLKIYTPHIVPVKVKTDRPMDAEEQIAIYEKEYCETHGIPPENFFHDSTGRGSLGTALSRVWSSLCNPVEFGGAASKRPVTQDLFITDQKTGIRRLKLAYEHYIKFVTELWFAARYCIEADQMRGLPSDVMEEGCMREWSRGKEDKIEVETKKEMKDRVGRSPDLFDWLVIAIEGARRRGFLISKLGNDIAEDKSRYNWLNELAKKRMGFNKSKRLTHA